MFTVTFKSGMCLFKMYLSDSFQQEERIHLLWADAMFIQDVIFVWTCLFQNDWQTSSYINAPRWYWCLRNVLHNVGFKKNLHDIFGSKSKHGGKDVGNSLVYIRPLYLISSEMIHWILKNVISVKNKNNF